MRTNFIDMLRVPFSIYIIHSLISSLTDSSSSSMYSPVWLSREASSNAKQNVRRSAVVTWTEYKPLEPRSFPPSKVIVRSQQSGLGRYRKIAS